MELSRKVALFRNTGLLAAIQALNALIVQVFVVYGPIAILLLGGSPSLAGLGMAFVWGGRLVSTVQMGLIMDKSGRRPVIAGGMVLAAASVTSAAYAVASRNLTLFLLTLLMFGVARGMGEFTRVAVADLLPPSKRGLGTGVILTASIAGTITAPLLISTISHHDTPELRHVIDTFNFSLTAALAGAAAALLVWPEPLKIAGQTRDVTNSVTMGLKKIREPGISLAVLSAAVSTGMMVAVMSLNTLLMYQHHHSAVDISTVVMIHVIGMYAFSIPLGKLSDGSGRVTVISLGLAAELLGVVLLIFPESMLVVSTALFLVGLGWSAVWVSSSAYIADLTMPRERGSVTGAADATAAAASIIVPIISGVVLEVGGANILVALLVSLTAPLIYLCAISRKK